MAVFQYKARDKTGSLVIGNMDASNEDMVSQELGKMGHFPISIAATASTAVASEKKSQDIFARFRKVQSEELVLFTRQLATLFNAGIPILGALAALREQIKNPMFQSVLESIRKDIEGGLALSEAMVKFPKVFDQLYVSMIRAGEEGGVLDQILRRLADLLERQEENRAKLKSATRYPKMVVGAMFIAVSILMYKVVPVFVSMFKRADIELPLPTQLLITAHSIFVEWWLITLTVGGILYFLFKRYIATDKGKFQWHTFLLNLPLLGPIFLRSEMAKFARVFGTLQRGGVPILETIDVSANVVNNVVIAGIIRGLSVSVQEGMGLAIPLSRSEYVPPLVIQMIAAGEESGSLDEMLIKVAEYYDEEVDRAVKRFSVMLEPLLIVVIGVFVLFLMLAIFLPMWDMSKIARRR